MKTRLTNCSVSGSAALIFRPGNFYSLGKQTIATVFMIVIIVRMIKSSIWLFFPVITFPGHLISKYFCGSTVGTRSTVHILAAAYSIYNYNFYSFVKLNFFMMKVPII